MTRSPCRCRTSAQVEILGGGGGDLVPKSRPNSCDPMDCGLPGPSVHGMLQAGMLQARMLEWVAMPSSRGSSPPRDQTCISVSPARAGGFFITRSTWEAHKNVVTCCGSNRRLIWGPRNKPGQLSFSGDQQ